MLTAKSVSRWGANIKEKTFPKSLQVKYSLLADCSLLGLAQSAILTWMECTGDLNSEEFGGRFHDGL